MFRNSSGKARRGAEAATASPPAAAPSRQTGTRASPFDVRSQPIANGDGELLSFTHRTSPGGRSGELTWADVLLAWRTNPHFNDVFSAALARSSFTDFFWETPAVSGAEGLHAPFRCVLLDAGGCLARARADCSDFAEHMPAKGALEQVVSFPNLGGDALLVVPSPAPRVGRQAYGSLAAFVREGPREQLNQLWRVVSEEVQLLLAQAPSRPLWISTDGRGVAWVHVRLDARPKYIKYAPFERAPLLEERSGARSSQRAEARGAAPDVDEDDFEADEMEDDEEQDERDTGVRGGGAGHGRSRSRKRAPKDRLGR